MVISFLKYKKSHFFYNLFLYIVLDMYQRHKIHLE